MEGDSGKSANLRPSGRTVGSVAPPSNSGPAGSLDADETGEKLGDEPGCVIQQLPTVKCVLSHTHAWVGLNG